MRIRRDERPKTIVQPRTHGRSSLSESGSANGKPSSSQPATRRRSLGHCSTRCGTNSPEHGGDRGDDGSTDDTAGVARTGRGLGCKPPLLHGQRRGDQDRRSPCDRARSSSSWTATASTTRRTSRGCWRSWTRATRWWSGRGSRTPMPRWTGGSPTSSTIGSPPG